MTDRSSRRGRTKWFRPRLQSPGECVDVEKETAEDEKKIKEELWKEKQEALLLLAKEAKDRRMKKAEPPAAEQKREAQEKEQWSDAWTEAEASEEEAKRTEASKEEAKRRQAKIRTKEKRAARKAKRFLNEQKTKAALRTIEQSLRNQSWTPALESYAADLTRKHEGCRQHTL